MKVRLDLHILKETLCCTGYKRTIVLYLLGNYNKYNPPYEITTLIKTIFKHRACFLLLLQ